jgi:cytochrome c-type biogenesis protein CcmH/NrfG
MLQYETDMTNQSGTTHSGTSLRVIAVLAIFPALLYINTIGNSFQYDDKPLIVGNAYVHNLSNVGHFFVSSHLISGHELSGYRPLTMTTFAINYAIGKDNPMGYHLFNVAIHVLSVLLVFGVSLSIMNVLEIRKSRAAALAVAMLFAAHPINTQPVNYIAGRSTLLVGCFSLASFLLYARGLKKDEALHGKLFMAGSLALLLCALLSKEEAVAVPGLLVAYELLRLRLQVDGKSIRRITIRLFPFALLTLGFMIFVIRIMGIVGDTAPARGIGENLLTQAKVLFIYLKMIAVPTGLSIDHVIPTLTSLTEPVAIASVLGIVALVCGSLWLARRAPVITLGAWWMLIALVPTSTLIALKLVLNEQRLYLAAVGMMLIAGAGFGEALVRVDKAGRNRMRQALVCCLVAILAIFSALTIRRNTEWRDPMSLWTSALERYPDSMRANAQVADEYLGRNQAETALPFAERAVKAGPDVVEARLVLASTQSRLGLQREALTNARKAVDLKPGSSEAQSTLGTIYVRLERWSEAETAWERALELNPHNEDARANLERLQAMQTNAKNRVH